MDFTGPVIFAPYHECGQVVHLDDICHTRLIIFFQLAGILAGIAL
jgi:hypothetical protein